MLECVSVQSNWKAPFGGFVLTTHIPVVFYTTSLMLVHLTFGLEL